MKFEHAGDALHVIEVPDIKEGFFLTLDARFDNSTRILEKDEHSNTTIEFFKLLLAQIKTHLENQNLRSLGAVVQCNGYSYGIVLIRNEKETEYVIFDSHGCRAVNGHDKAFIYWADNLDEASTFLGHLIKFSDLDLSSLQSFKESCEVNGLNQVAVNCFRSTPPRG